MSKSGIKKKEPSFNSVINNDLAKRDQSYTMLLRSYVWNQRVTNFFMHTFKTIFFFIACIVFVGVVFFGAYGIYHIACKESVSWQDIGVALTGLGSIVSVVIILPSKIADNLFPASNNKESTEFITMMQKYDNSLLAGDDELVDSDLDDDPELTIQTKK